MMRTFLQIRFALCVLCVSVPAHYTSAAHAEAASETVAQASEAFPPNPQGELASPIPGSVRFPVENSAVTPSPSMTETEVTSEPRSLSVRNWHEVVMEYPDSGYAEQAPPVEQQPKAEGQLRVGAQTNGVSPGTVTVKSTAGASSPATASSRRRPFDVMDLPETVADIPVLVRGTQVAQGEQQPQNGSPSRIDPQPNGAERDAQRRVPVARTSVPVASLAIALREAREFDAQYRAGLAERSYNESTATASRLAYTPQLSYTRQQLDIDTGTRSTLSLSQPVFSWDKFFSMMQAEPRSVLAASTLAQRDQDLGQRLLQAVTELVRTRDVIRLSAYLMDALKEQATRAQRMYDLGQGTITDMRDAAVRYEQARASQLTAMTRMQVAESKFALIVGAPPAPQAFTIVDVPPRIVLDAPGRYSEQALARNPLVILARQNERIAELDSQRSKSAALPTVSAVFANTQLGQNRKSYSGFSVSFPLQATSIAQIAGARAQAERATEQRRQAEQEAQVDVDRLRSLVESGQQEFTIRKEGILAAELAVDSNLKSQQGGVRTTVDVLNAIQTLATVRNDYVNTAATLAENYMSLLLRAGYTTDEAITRIERTLFGS